MGAVAEHHQKELADARSKLQQLQRMKEEKLLEMRAFKLELEQKRAAMKRETALMRETVFDQMSDKITARMEEDEAAAAAAADQTGAANGAKFVAIAEEEEEEVEEGEELAGAAAAVAPV